MVTQEHHVALVDHLVESSAPVRRIWPVRLRATAVLASWTLAALALASPRPDLALRLHDGAFLTGLFMLAIATSYTTFLALRCAVPGRAPTDREATIAAFVLVAATVAIGATPADRAPADGWLCSARTVAIAALPWIMLLVAIRRGAPVRVGNAAIYAGAASLLFATTVLRLACPSDGSRHWLTWHLAVIPLATLLAAPLAMRWLRSWRVA